MELLDKCLALLKEKGADEGEVSLTHFQNEEMELKAGEISLLRSRDEYHLTLQAIVDKKKASIQINKIDDEAIAEAVTELLRNAENSQADEANEVSGQIQEREFSDFKDNYDPELMYKRLDRFREKAEADYPDLVLEGALLEYQNKFNYYRNTKGVKLSSNYDKYLFYASFFGRRDELTSSMNGTGIALENLEGDLYELASLPSLMREAVEHLDARLIDGKKFSGDILITPDSLSGLLYSILSHLGNSMLIAGTSYFKDKLNEKVLNEKFTLRTEPVSEYLAVKDYYGGDGIINRNDYIFEKGVLNNYLLDLYGSKKTGLERGPSTGSNLVVEAGDKSLPEMIASIDRGIILGRFSGGHPATNGDFSGVAKNSYYIEDGEIKYPIKETMISGNLFELFQNIVGISRERVNFGFNFFPYIHAREIVISSR
ncbi:MAG: TldD/PmbA family protein [Halanaerobiaceae bacterium]|nr:TldD/PmbA family protein [Halanaerobiaceae bacterium]